MTQQHGDPGHPATGDWVRATVDAWSDMRRRLDEVVAPLQAVGWRVIENCNEESWEFGDSVAYDLQRGNAVIDVELYEAGAIDVYRLDDEVDDPDADPSPPLFSLEYDDGSSKWREAFAQQQWLDPG